jgi:hypothetical protein
VPHSHVQEHEDGVDEDVLILLPTCSCGVKQPPRRCILLPDSAPAYVSFACCAAHSFDGPCAPRRAGHVDLVQRVHVLLERAGAAEGAAAALRRANKRLAACVRHFVPLHVGGVGKCFVALGKSTTEGLIAGMNTNVSLQCGCFEKALSAVLKCAIVPNNMIR